MTPASAAATIAARMPADQVQRSATTGLLTLGLPVRQPGSLALATLALFAFYAATMARDLSLYDSGELALAAAQLSLGHPPGQPLHTLLGFLLSKLPLLPTLVSLGLASALPAALTLLPAVSLGQALLAAPDDPPSDDRLLRGLPALLALFAAHACLWEPATRVEVYALATLFAVWAVARLATLTGEPSDVRKVAHAGFALGLCACANPMIALCTGVAVAPALLARMASRRLSPRALGSAVLGGALGLLPYLYVPLAAATSDGMVWGAPRDAQSLWHYLSLRDYVHVQQLTLALWAEHAVLWFVWAAEQRLFPVLALGAAGHVLLGARTSQGRFAALGLLLLLVAVVSSNVVWNLDVPDYNGYVASGLWLLAAGACALCLQLFAAGRKGAALIFAGALVAASLFSSPHVLARTRAHDHLARDLAQHVLDEAPRDAIVITQVDHLAGALFYLQEIERKRPDVVVLAYGLGSSSWHWEHIHARHPRLSHFALRGAGGKPARVRRFLAANASRPVLVEELGLASELGLRACPGGLYLRTGGLCEPRSAPDPWPADYLARTLRVLGNGSPGAAGAIAQASYSLGVSLWALGEPRAAYHVLLAGVPAHMLAEPRTPPAEIDRAPSLARPLPAFQRGAALGDPARNLFVAGVILQAAGRPQDAQRYLAAAARDGLPEANALLSD